MILVEISKLNLSENFLYILLEQRITWLYDNNKDKLEKRFNDDNTIPENLKTKLGTGDVAKNLIDYFSEIDPSQKKLYVQWIIKRYLTNSTIGDIESLSTVLKDFDKIKLKMDQADINKYKSIDELSNAVKNYEDTQVEWLINKPNFKALIPKTHKASCMYMGDTNLCTANKNPKNYNDYSEKGNLIIILAGSGNNLQKFQIHVENGEFNNKNNNPINEKEIDYLSGFPEYKKLLNYLIKNHYFK